MRDSLKRMEFQESLHLRTSNLRLHDMDEVAVSRHSQLSVGLSDRRFIIKLNFQNRLPANSSNRRSSLTTRRESKYGYEETSVNEHRKKSLAAMSNPTESEVAYLATLAKQRSDTSFRCLCLPPIYCRR